MAKMERQQRRRELFYFSIVQIDGEENERDGAFEKGENFRIMKTRKVQSYGFFTLYFAIHCGEVTVGQGTVFSNICFLKNKNYCGRSRSPLDILMFASKPIVEWAHVILSPSSSALGIIPAPGRMSPQ